MTEDRAAVLDRLFDVRGLGAVVTGAASGIGLAIAEVLATCGARVTLADADPEALARETARLAGQGADVRGAVVDVADPAAVDTVLREAAEAHGGLHVVFANAGMSAGPGPTTPEGQLTAVEQARWDRVIQVNLGGVFATLQAAARHVADGGRVVVTSSIAGLAGDPMVGYAYAAAKAGVVALVHQASADLGRRGILVNAIAPGSIRTNIAGGRIRRPRWPRRSPRPPSWAGSATPRRCRAWPCSWRPRRPATSPARRSPSTAERPRCARCPRPRRPRPSARRPAEHYRARGGTTTSRPP